MVNANGRAATLRRRWKTDRRWNGIDAALRSPKTSSGSRAAS